MELRQTKISSLLAKCLSFNWSPQGREKIIKLGTDHYKSYGDGGEFSSRMIFFFVIIFLVRFFLAITWIFLGLIGVHEFFSFNFPLREYFFCTSPAPLPYKFSNGPSLNNYFTRARWKWDGERRNEDPPNGELARRLRGASHWGGYNAWFSLTCCHAPRVFPLGICNCGSFPTLLHAEGDNSPTPSSWSTSYTFSSGASFWVQYWFPYNGKTRRFQNFYKGFSSSLREG